MPDNTKVLLTASALIERLEIIEMQIESIDDAQRRMWEYLDQTAELTALLSEAQDGID